MVTAYNINCLNDKGYLMDRDYPNPCHHGLSELLILTGRGRGGAVMGTFLGL